MNDAAAENGLNREEEPEPEFAPAAEETTQAEDGDDGSQPIQIASSANGKAVAENTQVPDVLPVVRDLPPLFCLVFSHGHHQP